MPAKLSPTQVAFNAQGDGKFNLPFAEQIHHFQQKIDIPTQRWDDILNSAHDKAFIVAGATKADLLADLHSAVEKSIAEGKSLQWFRKEFDQIVAKHGWQGYTGSETQAGRDWRTKVIYQTNLSTSYAAGRYAQLTDPDLLKLRPNWEYLHSDAVAHPRPLHVEWNGTVLPADDAWWDTHFAPNGFGCHCRITAVSADRYDGKPAPNNGTYIYKDRAGKEHELPKGVDYGFGYTPGKSTTQNLQPFINNKLTTLPPPLANALKTNITHIPPRKIPNVSDSLAPPKSGATKTAVTNTLNAIDKVHSIENLPTIPIKSSTSQAFQGAYMYDLGGKPYDIKISNASVNPELTVAHEIGHFIDHQAFGNAGTFSSIADGLFADWRDAINASSATETLKDILSTHPQRGIRKRAEYYLNVKEQWARSYAQWIAIRSKDATMQAQVKKIAGHIAQPVYAASQWQAPDFTAIADAIDGIFKALGLLK